MLLDLGDDVERFGDVVAFAGDAHSVIDRRKMPFFELHVQDRTDYLNDVSNSCGLL